MQLSGKRPPLGAVLGLVAVAIAVAGTANAGPQATTSILTKKERKQVRKIARSVVNRLASGLTVASAADADRLDGQDAADFTPAGEVHSPARFVRNDPVPGDDDTFAYTPLLDLAPGFSVSARCSENFNGTGQDQAQLRVFAPDNSSFSGPVSGGADVNLASAAAVQPASVFSAGNEVRAGHLVVVAPSGEVMSVSASAEVGDPAGDCVFGVTALGP